MAASHDASIELNMLVGQGRFADVMTEQLTPKVETDCVVAPRASMQRTEVSQDI
jgi:hypothetical protein